MGACLSCLGLRQDSSNEAERHRLLYDDPYSNAPGANYGSWSQAPPVPSQNLMSPEEMQREQQALNNITRWASDQIVEIFPHRTAFANLSIGPSAHLNGNGGHETASMNAYGPGTENGNGNHVNGGMTVSAHQDILLNMIPGDKSKRSIRIYPASRPGSSNSHNTDSIQSRDSATKLNGHAGTESKRRGVFVTLNVESS